VLPGGGEVGDVAGVEDIEAAIRDDEAESGLALLFAPGGEGLPGEDFRGRVGHRGGVGAGVWGKR